VAPRLRPSLIVSAAWIIPAALAVVDVVAQRRLSGEPHADVSQLVFAGGDWLLYACLTPFVFVLSARWPIARPHLPRNAGVHVALSLLFCAAWAGAGTVLRAIVAPKTMWFPPLKHFVSWLFITFPFGVAVYLCVVGIEHAIRYFADARERELQMARLAEQVSAARFAALQAQLNPHFLFNTLNTIAVLVRDGDRAAVRIVEQLSDVLRRILTRHRTNEVPLAEELELVRQYLAIEQARFSDRLRPTFDVDESLLAAAVPGFAIQHLVENAIRHGIARRSEAGQIAVTARRVGDQLEVTVVDDGLAVDEERATVRGHGLANTRERLRALYGDRASLEIAPATAQGTVAALRLPLHTAAAESDDAR
jgi:signal transduction histidine kinase